MATKKQIQDVFDANKYNLSVAVEKSSSWYKKQILALSKENITPNKILQGDITELTNSIRPGFLYMYKYDPKTKDTLPYYDAFPLVFPFRKTKNGFYGLNMHYLPYELRIKLLDELLVFKSNNRWDETTKIKYSWEMINGISKFAPAQPCVKQYLIAHVKSSFRQISSDDWATAMLLPVEKFVGASKQQVWADSRKIIRKYND
jgi:hypothetical protein